MILRTSGHLRRSSRRPSRLRPAVGCAAIATLLLAVSAGTSGASLSDYTGTLYLTKTASAVASGNWQLSTTAPSSLDSTTQNRVALSATGYAAFAPGVSPGALANSAVSASISVSSCTGWIVDGSGGMTFAAGT